MMENKNKLLKLFKEWSKEDDIWSENLKHTELFIGFIFADAIVMSIIVILPLIIFGENKLIIVISSFFAFGYVLYYYNFYNWANNGLKAHLKFKEFKHGIRELQQAD